MIVNYFMIGQDIVMTY